MQAGLINCAKPGINVTGHATNVYSHYTCCTLVLAAFTLYSRIGRAGRGNISCVRLLPSYRRKRLFNASVCDAIRSSRHLANDVVVAFYGHRLNPFSRNSSVLYSRHVLPIFPARQNPGCVKPVSGVSPRGCGHFPFICS